MCPSPLSQTLRNLEERLDLKLLNRTTRSVTTTEAGDRLLELVGPALDDIDAGLYVRIAGLADGYDPLGIAPLAEDP